jgi:hypothetical protein
MVAMSRKACLEHVQRLRYAIEVFLRHRWTSRLMTAVLFAIVALTMVRVVSQDTQGLPEWLSHLTLSTLLLMFGTHSLALGMGAIAWCIIIMRTSQLKRIKDHFRIYTITNLARRIPGLPWHIVGRTYLYNNVGIPKTLILMVSGLEHVLIVLSGILVYLLTAALFPNGCDRVGWGWLALALVTCLILTHPRLLTIVLNRLGRKMTQPLQFRDLMLWMVVYIVTWMVGGLTLWVLVGSIGNLTLVKVLTVIGAWSLSGAVSSLAVFLPAGLGIREISLTLLLSSLVPLSTAAFVALVLRLLTTAFELTWGVLITLLLRPQHELTQRDY